MFSKIYCLRTKISATSFLSRADITIEIYLCEKHKSYQNATYTIVNRLILVSINIKHYKQIIIYNIQQVINIM